MQTTLENDVLYYIEHCPGASYASLCDMLKAYEAQAVFTCVNSLVDKGKIRMGSQGFEHCEKSVGTSAAAPNSKDCKPTVTVKAPERLQAEDEKEQPPATSSNALSEKSHIEANKVAEAISDIAAASQNASDKTLQAPASSNARATWFRELSRASKGSLLATSSIKLLGLPDAICDSFIKTGIATISDLVARIDALGKTMPKSTAIYICQALVKYSSEPPKLDIGNDTRQQLHCFSGSSSFAFDWLGVLTTTLSKTATDTLLEEAITMPGSKQPGKRDDVFESLAATYTPEVKTTVLRLEKHLKSKGYPVNADTFEAIMLPIVSLGFEIGDYENEKEALSAAETLIDSSTQTVDACFGLLRDQILEARANTQDLSPINVRSADAFIAAAKRIAALDCGCTFDAANKRLNIL